MRILLGHTFGMPSHDEKIAFAERLKQALKRSRKKVETAADLALQFNLRHSNEPVTPQAAQKWLSGKSRPMPDKIETLADWLGVSAQWLRYGVGEKIRAQPTRLVSKEPAASSVGYSDEERELIEKMRLLTEHRRYLIIQIIRELALEQEMWLS
ncbi:transcriptional regulator [Paralcaligenes ginsengisoli]